MPRSRLLLPILALLFTAALLGGCDQLLNDDEEEGISDLVGAWIAQSMTFTNVSNPAQSVDIVDAGGSFTLDIQDGGNLIVTQVWPGDAPESFGGTWTADDDSLFVDDGEGVFGMAYTLSGDVLTIERSGESFDFDDDGTDEAASLVIVLDRHTYEEGDLAALAGAWTAGQFLFTNPANPSQTYDLIEWGGVFVIKVDAGGTYQLLNVWPDDEGDPTIQTGAISATAESLTVVTPDGPMTLGYGVSPTDADYMEMDLAAPLFDWDDDGTDDPATLHIALTRDAEPALGDMAGVWTLQNLTVQDLENPGSTVDFPMPWDEVIVVDVGGTFTHFSVAPYDSLRPDTGTLTVFGGALIIDDNDPEAGAQAVRMNFDGTTLSVSFPEWVDHDMDGTEEPVRIDTGYTAYSGPTLTDMAGPWSAYQYLLDPEADLPIRYLVGDGGTFTIKMESGGAFEVIQTYPGWEDHIGTGTMTLFGPVIEAIDDGTGYRSYIYLEHFGGGELQIHNPYSYWDANDDGFDDLVTELISMNPATEIDVSALAGTWTASIMEFSDPTDTYPAYDMVAEGGSFSLAVDASGNFDVTITAPDESVDTDSGTITVVGDMLKIYSSGDMSTTAVQYVLVDANTLQLFSNDESHDFDGDSTDEPAVMFLALSK